MYCSKCGTQQADDTVFCSACGQATGVAPRAAAQVISAGPGAPAAYGNPGYPPARATIAVPSPYAGFWLRFLAYIIDSIVLGVIFGVVALLAIASVGVGYFHAMIQGMQDGTGEFPVAFISALLIASLLSLVVSWIYHAWMESSEYQATLGKMALGLIVTDLNDRPVTFARATGRFFAKLITGLIPLGIGYIMAGFTEKKQALHDMIASSLVLKKR
ncbi:MAG TPA: RDD family protein [Candidatus Acidoferrales bacterium]